MDEKNIKEKLKYDILNGVYDACLFTPVGKKGESIYLDWKNAIYKVLK